MTFGIVVLVAVFFIRVGLLCLKVLWKGGWIFAGAIAILWYGTFANLGIVSTNTTLPRPVAFDYSLAILFFGTVAWWTYRWLYSKVTGENARHIWQVFHA